MTLRFKGLSAQSLTPAPIPTPRIIPSSAAGEAEVANHIRMAEAESVIGDTLVESAREDPYIPPQDEDDVQLHPEIRDSHLEGSAKLSRLIDDDFPFDDSQLVAINGLASQQYGCMTGAAGTGKTTTTKAIVDRIKEGLGEVDMKTYWRNKAPTAVDEDDDYVMPETRIPSICLVGFTGRSTQMIKKNFPRDWHGNIMTIHRCLGFAPEFYEDWDDELQEMRNKMRFTPTYNASLLLPWDVIIIDEAGMLGVPLWDQLWAAMKPGCRVFMIGDINQLPPVHGRSIFGFALSEWPAYELTHIHRQKVVNEDGSALEIKNSIVENAWAILQGYRPKSDIAGLSLGDSTNSLASKTALIESLQKIVRNKDWKFLMVAIPEDPDICSQRIRKALELLAGKIYDPIHDSIITAINGHDGSRGMNIGQIPMNRELAIKLNSGAPRFIIDGGRERKQFAVGDKVMATKNDYEAGITNGMTGIITDIAQNGAYAGDSLRFGLVADVNRYLADTGQDEEEEFSLESVADSYAAQDAGKERAKEGRDRGPASHIVTVKFGEGDHAFEIKFESLSEVASLMTAYVVTCHKMQGGESPLVGTILHQSHKAMLFREWGYTALTRASERAIFFYTDLGLRVMLNKQKITGKTLKEKVRFFQALGEDSVAGKAVNVNLPKAISLAKGIAERRDSSAAKREAGISKALDHIEKRIEAAGPTPSSAAPPPPTDPIPEPRVIYVVMEEALKEAPPPPIDGGDVTPQERQKVKSHPLFLSAMYGTQGKLKDMRGIAGLLEHTPAELPHELQAMVDHANESIRQVTALPMEPLQPKRRFGVKAS